MSSTIENNIQHAEDLADRGEFQDAIELLAEILAAGETSTAVLNMYADVTRLAEERTYHELHKRFGDRPSVILHYAKTLRGSRQRTFLNRALEQVELDERTRIELKLLRFENGLTSGAESTVEDFLDVWRFGDAAPPKNRVRLSLLSVVARA
ncbi:MAG: hypothetical protein ACNA8W_24010, partial [Bradymonadaceae bacterium]